MIPFTCQGRPSSKNTRNITHVWKQIKNEVRVEDFVATMVSSVTGNIDSVSLVEIMPTYLRIICTSNKDNTKTRNYWVKRNYQVRISR